MITRLITAPTSGPTNRYRWALFVIAVMSTKGMSTTASRLLVEKLSRKGVTVLVARDFDKAGFSIVHTMHADTRRYQFSRRPRVVDIGLRLGDVREMGLDHEPVDYRRSTSPAINLRECGATDEEIDFLVYPSYYGGSWAGWRVELNAMTSDEFIAWLERKFQEVGVQKVVPDEKTLAAAYRRAIRVARISKAIEAAAGENPDTEIAISEHLADRTRDRIAGTALAWDHALVDLVNKEIRNS